MKLNIAWMTSRKEPKLEWFLDSLHRECRGDYKGLRIIIVDFWLQVMPDLNWTADDVELRLLEWSSLLKCQSDFALIPPKPTVWQGPHKLTKQNYFAAANARSTAICVAHNGWLAYVDDLSVLMPGWLGAVREAMALGYIVCGAFRKVNKIVVENGEMKSFEDHAPGFDSRWKGGDANKAVPCPPNWLFGCSVAAPVEAFLKVNGWPELCDSTGIGMEDCHMGIALANNKYELRYDRRMLTFESEELHHVEKPMIRMDKNRGTAKRIGDHPDEKGHWIVQTLKNAGRFTNYFEPDGIAGLRARILAGEDFPIVGIPQHDAYDGQALSEL